MIDNSEEINFSDTVKQKDGKIFRIVDNIDETKRIIDIIKNSDYLSDCVVDTKIYSDEKKIVQHEFLKGIIHSEEYTETMAYDVSELALEMCIELEKFGICGWDLLPHNFTFNNGRWILYDFEGLSLETRKIKALARGFFKIVFSSFEFTKLISRKELGQYYLNRVKCSQIFTMIPFVNWLKYFLNLQYSLYLIRTKQFKKMYEFLHKILQNYYSENADKSYVYQPKLLFNNNLNNFIVENLQNQCISDIFSVGEEAANFSLPLNENIHKTIYIDDYELCDSVYKYVRNNKMKNVNIGVLYPLENDNEIPANYKYRAVFDNYAKKRFVSDCAMCLGNVEIDLVKNLSDFANKLLIVKANKNNIDVIKETLLSLYNEIKTAEYDSEETIILAFNKKTQFEYKEYDNSYKNFNRGYNADKQTEQIKHILKKAVK